MEKFTNIIKADTLPEELVPTKIESPILKWSQIHTLYVIPLFVDTNEVGMVAHSPKNWESKSDDSWLTYMSGEFDDNSFNWDRIKGILEKYGFVLNRSVKFECMNPLYKSPSERGTILCCVLYVDQYDYDENDLDRPTSYRIKRNSLVSDIKFPDMCSVILTNYLLSV